MTEGGISASKATGVRSRRSSTTRRGAWQRWALSLSASEARERLVRAARAKRGDVGELDYYCPDCQRFFLEPGDGSPDFGHMVLHEIGCICPFCGSENADMSEFSDALTGPVDDDAQGTTATRETKP